MSVDDLHCLPGYYHESFLRTKRFLSLRIHRLKIKGTGVRRPSSPQTEPNFYNMAFLPHFKKVESGPPTKTKMTIMEPVFQQHLVGRGVADPPAKSIPVVVDVSFPSSCSNIDVKNTRCTAYQQQEGVFTEAVASVTQRVGEALPENWSLSCEPRPLIEPISVVQMYSPWSDYSLLAKINLLKKHRRGAGTLERFDSSTAGLLSVPLHMFQNQREPEIQPFWASCTEDSLTISDFKDVLDSLLKMPELSARPSFSSCSSANNASASHLHTAWGVSTVVHNIESSTKSGGTEDEGIGLVHW
jgi:hypothetical protein